MDKKTSAVGMLVEPNLPPAVQRQLLDIGDELGAHFYGATTGGFLKPRELLNVSQLKHLDLFIVANRFLVPEPEAKRNVFIALEEPVYRYNLFGYAVVSFDDLAANAWGISPPGDLKGFLASTLDQPPMDFGVEFFVGRRTFVWGHKPQWITVTLHNESDEMWIPATHNVSSFWRAWKGQAIKQSARCTTTLPWPVSPGDPVTIRARIPKPPIAAGRLRLVVGVRHKGKHLERDVAEVPLKVLS